MPFEATRIDLEMIILIEGSQRREISYDITYMWNLKKMIQVNLFIKQKQTPDLENKLMVPKGESFGGGG